MKDAEYMERAIKLAARGLGHTRPNPAVGAVIVKGGKIIGEGWHKKAGGDHAEVAAIKNALRGGGCGCAGTAGTDGTDGTGVTTACGTGRYLVGSMQKRKGFHAIHFHVLRDSGFPLLRE